MRHTADPADPAFRSRVTTFLAQTRLQRRVLMGLETSAGVKAHAVAWILALNQIVLAIFVVEVAAQMFAHRSAFLFNAMQTFTESEHKATEALVETAGQSMEQVLHAEVPSLRQEIRELSGLLVPVLQGAAQFTQPFPKESPST
jgi:polyhydroxyalkanoate synthesis regulator protein